MLRKIEFSKLSYMSHSVSAGADGIEFRIKEALLDVREAFAEQKIALQTYRQVMPFLVNSMKELQSTTDLFGQRLERIADSILQTQGEVRQLSGDLSLNFALADTESSGSSITSASQAASSTAVFQSPAALNTERKAA